MPAALAAGDGVSWDEDYTSCFFVYIYLYAFTYIHGVMTQCRQLPSLWALPVMCIFFWFLH